ncbi:MAG: ATP-binding protein [Bacteroidales bacterium]|nr:ATP-binding protein [Bacteroidales bacterium]
MNPFTYGTVATGESFYDRDKECDYIVKTLAGGNNIVMYAPRRFGKTSLVIKAIQKLEKQGFTCIYFDFMPVFSTESFVRLYTKSLAKQQSNLQKFASTFSTIVKNIRPVIKFGLDGSPEFSIDIASKEIDETDVSQLFDLTESLSRSNKPVLVFLDEFQEVEKLKEINFEGLLRSKIQHQQQVNYLFFGSKTHMMQAMFNDKKRPFYNAASQMTISYLPEEDTIEFLQNNFLKKRIELNTEIANYIIKVTANIPYYIQQLASEIWLNTKEKVIISIEIVDMCVEQVIIMKKDYFMELFENQSASKKQLLIALCTNGENIFSESYRSTHRLPSTATLQRAERGLIYDGVIDKIDNKHFITDPFFKLFLNSYINEQF